MIPYIEDGVMLSILLFDLVYGSSNLSKLLSVVPFCVSDWELNGLLVNIGLLDYQQ